MTTACRVSTDSSAKTAQYAVAADQRREREAHGERTATR